MKNLFVFITIAIITFGNVNAQSSKKNDTIKIMTSSVCSQCKERLESKMAYEKGVVNVSNDLETKICTIIYKTDKTDPDKLRLAISKIGYDADTILADKEAYEKLPACCKKESQHKGHNCGQDH